MTNEEAAGITSPGGVSILTSESPRLRKVLAECSSQFNPKTKQLLLLWYGRADSEKSIAAVLDIPVGILPKRAERALTLLHNSIINKHVYVKKDIIVDRLRILGDTLDVSALATNPGHPPILRTVGNHTTAFDESPDDPLKGE
jgi:hypothetical protein